MCFAVLTTLLHIIHILSPAVRSLFARVLDVHLVDFEPAGEEGDGVGEDHAVGGEDVAVWGGGEEVLDPDAED